MRLKFLWLIMPIFLMSCGEDLCIGGFGKCGFADSRTPGNASASGEFQIDIAGSWPRQPHHLPPSNRATGYNSTLNVIVRGGRQPYQAVQFSSSGPNQGTLPVLKAGKAGFVGVYTAPGGPNPNVVLMVQDSSSPQQTAYLPLTIDAQ
jgi:hypothetical protein